jgi:hypothetical protein
MAPLRETPRAIEYHARATARQAPALNAIENVWQYIRDNWLSNRVFHSGKNTVDHCSDAWNKLIDRPWCIMSIGLRDWAHGF